MSKKKKTTNNKIPCKRPNCITKESSFFQLNLKLGSFFCRVICFQVSYSLFVFRSSLSGHDCRSQVLLKALGSCPYLRNGYNLIRVYFLGSTGLGCWSLLAGRRRILRQYFWIWINSYRSHIILSGRRVRGSNCRKVKHILYFPQLR